MSDNLYHVNFQIIEAMKIKTIKKEFYFVNSESDVDKYELEILDRDIKAFVDNVRKVQAKANRLCSLVETCDHEPELQDFSEFSADAYALLLYLYKVNGFLGFCVSALVNFDSLKSTSQVTNDPGMIKIFEDSRFKENFGDFVKSIKNQ